MKHPILLVAFLLLPLLAFSQGVKFEQGSWKDALALAKKTNKPVLLDFYSSDDEPTMRRLFGDGVNKGILSRETVGDVCNTYFVCYRMDKSKKEGLELLKSYNLDNRSVVLIVDADGRLLSNLGSLILGDASYFLEQVKAVLLNLRDPKPITAWDAEFPKKKKDSTFLLAYIDKRMNLGLDYNEAFEAYLRLLPANGPMNIKTARLLQSNTNRMLVSDYAFHYLSNNKKEFSTTLDLNLESENWYFRSVVERTINAAAKSKDEALLEKAIAVFKQIPYDPEKKQEEELYMSYYEQTKEPVKDLPYARLFVANMLKKLESDDLLKDYEKKALKNLEEQLASETDTAKINLYKRNINEIRNGQRNQLCRQLNHIAWYFFQNTSDAAILKEILPWSEKSVQWNPTTADYLDTNAQILYKLGRKEEAIALQKRAVANNTNTNWSSYTAINENVEKDGSGREMVVISATIPKY